MTQADQFGLVIGHFAYFLADAHYCGVFEAQISANRAFAWVVLTRAIKEALIDSLRIYHETERLEGGSTQKMVLAKDLIDYSFPLLSLTLHYHPILHIIVLLPYIQVLLQYLYPFPSDRLLEIL